MTKVDEIALLLESAILSGELPAGTVLRQDQLSSELSVSRTPVREALRQVAALGLVSLEPKRGARVRSFSPEELSETFIIRAELEGLAAQLAVARITRSELKDLHAAEQRFKKVTNDLRSRDDGDVAIQWLTSEWVAANGEFHDLILSAARSPLLEQMAKSVRPVFAGAIVWSNSPDVVPLYEVNLAQHRAIYDAFVRRDDDVRRLVSEHVVDSGKLLQLVLSKTSERRPLLGPTAARLSRAEA